MTDGSKIEWTDATWNIVTGCTLVSEGCRHCYAATLAAGRLKHHPSRKALARVNAAGEAKFTGEVRFNEKWLDQPLRWQKPRMIFVCAHGDLFHPGVPDAWIDKVFAVAAMTPRHTYQVLTKRDDRMRDYVRTRAGDYTVTLPDALPTGLYKCSKARADAILGGNERQRDFHRGHKVSWPLPNVWLGVSVEDQATADARVPVLLDTPAARRWVSYEPALGCVDFRHIDADVAAPGLGMYQIDALTGRNTDMARPCADVAKIDWIVMGGEIGPGARPMHLDWARKTRDDCAAAGVPFLFKTQCVSRVGKKAAGRALDGRLHDAWPTP